MSKDKVKEDMLEQEYEEENPQYKPGWVKTLNIVAGILFIVLLLVIYLPARIWKEEAQIRDLGHKRMTILSEVQDFYRQMAGEYQTDPILAMDVVSAVRDSTRADSNFHGKQVVALDDKTFEMDVIKNFYTTFDTTFAFKYEQKDTVLDTIYKVVMWNPNIFTNDTLFVNTARIGKVRSDSLFRGLLDTEVTSRVSTNAYYLPYYLEDKIAYSPLIEEQYVVEADSNDIKIADPLQGEFRESRFLVFAFSDTSHGYIQNGDKSWER